MPSFLGLDILSESPSVVRNADMISNFRPLRKCEIKKNEKKFQAVSCPHLGYGAAARQTRLLS